MTNFGNKTPSTRRVHYWFFAAPALIGITGGVITLFFKGKLFALKRIFSCMERHGIGFSCITEHYTHAQNNVLIIFNLILQGSMFIGWPLLLAWIYKKKLGLDGGLGFANGTFGCLLFMYFHWNLAIFALYLPDTGALIFFIAPLILPVYIVVSFYFTGKWLLLRNNGPRLD